MSKPNNFRKKALDYVKKRQWDKALEEFTRLVEIEQHNPNLFNEIGDIHLKLGDKREAFRRYHELSPEQQQQLRQRWQDIPPEQRQQMRERMQQMTPEQRQQMRQRMQQMTPEQRRQMREEMLKQSGSQGS